MGRHLLGLVLAAGSLTPVVLGARALRARLLPTWTGPPAWLADAVIALATVTVVLQVLGALLWFEVVPVVVATAAAGGLLLLAGRGRPNPPEARPAPRPEPSDPALHPATTVVSLIATAVVIGAWVTRVATSVHHGMRQPDSLYYHLPSAVRFVQEGSIGPLRVFDSEPLATFLPLNTSLVHAYGMLMFGDDVLSPYINLGWLGLALLAAWCAGARYGVAPLTLLGALVVLGAPGVVTTQAGEALNDIAALALVLSAIALLLHAGNEGFLPALSLAALAAGLGAGSKVTVLPLVGVLGIAAIVIAPAGRRLASGIAWTLGAAVGGGYWYLRNAVLAGNPLPTISLSAGPIHLDEQPSRSRLTPLADYVSTRRYWDDLFVPGLERFLGPLWWLVLPVAVAGAVLVVVRGRDLAARVVGAVALLGLASHLLSPQNNEWVSPAPVFFFANLRYAAPALTLALVALPLARTGRSRLWARVLLVALTALVLAAQLDGIWSTAPEDGRVSSGGLLLGVIVAAGVAVTLLTAPRAARWLPVAAAAAIVVLVLADGALDADRYRDTDPMPGIYRIMQAREDQKIAIVGDNQQFPLAGRDLSNRVRYLARAREGGLDIGPIRTCAAWRATLNRGGFDYVVIAPSLFPVPHPGEPPEVAWTEGDPAVRLVHRERQDFALGTRDFRLFRIRGRLAPDCG